MHDTHEMTHEYNLSICEYVRSVLARGRPF